MTSVVLDAVLTPRTVNLENIGGVDFIPVFSGRGMIGETGNAGNPLREYECKPVLVARDKTTNAEMDSYIAEMGEDTDGLVAETANGMHLLARGRIQKNTGRFVPSRKVPSDAPLLWGAITAIHAVSVVPPPATARYKDDKDLQHAEIFALPNHPATRVSLFDSVGYFAWKSEVTGRRWFLMPQDLRLYIATLGFNSPVEFATQDGTISPELAHYDNDRTKHRLTTAPVGSYPPTPAGFRDLTGNAWEWTSTRYKEGWHFFTVLGGSYRVSAKFLRAMYLNNYDPTDRVNSVGLRAAVAPQDSTDW